MTGGRVFQGRLLDSDLQNWMAGLGAAAEVAAAGGGVGGRWHLLRKESWRRLELGGVHYDEFSPNTSVRTLETPMWVCHIGRCEERSGLGASACRWWMKL